MERTLATPTATTPRHRRLRRSSIRAVDATLGRRRAHVTTQHETSANLAALSQPSALALDLDGTLVDTVEARIESWMRAFNEAGISGDRNQVARLIGADGKRLAREVAEAAGRNLDDDEAERLDRRSGEYYNEINTNPKPLPGARELLIALAASDVKSAIATSSRKEQVMASVDALQLPTRPEIVDGSHVTHAKPAPDLMLETAKRLQTQPSDCWCIGDATWDMRAAAAAGMIPVGVTTGAVDAAALEEAGAVATVASLAEIADELRRRQLIR
jgi:HAD superfamily hydrolase (TIGR01509 family)